MVVYGLELISVLPLHGVEKNGWYVDYFVVRISFLVLLTQFDLRPVVAVLEGGAR